MVGTVAGGRKMNNKTKVVVGVGLLTAIVVVLQVLAVLFPVGIFTITLSLVPMLVGAALYGPWAGAWLGFVFGFVVLLTNASAFMAVNPAGTIATCLLKGILAGLVAGYVYLFIKKKFDKQIVATVVAAIVEPIVNTGVFVIGCLIFFLPTIEGWFPGKVGFAAIAAMIGVNFFIEIAVNIALSTTIVQIIRIGRKSGVATTEE